jgi:hypothetical protein
MAPGRLTTRVVQVPVRARDASRPGAAPSSTAVLRELTSSPVLDEAADTLAEGSPNVVVYASTSSAFAIGFDAETATGITRRDAPRELIRRRRRFHR